MDTMTICETDSQCYGDEICLTNSNQGVCFSNDQGCSFVSEKIDDKLVAVLELNTVFMGKFNDAFMYPDERESVTVQFIDEKNEVFTAIQNVLVADLSCLNMSLDGSTADFRHVDFLNINFTGELRTCESCDKEIEVCFEGFCVPPTDPSNVSVLNEDGLPLAVVDNTLNGGGISIERFDARVMNIIESPIELVLAIE
eukprot:UN30067